MALMARTPTMNRLKRPGQPPAPPGFFFPGSKIAPAEQVLQIIGMSALRQVLFGLADNLAQRFFRHRAKVHALKRGAILYRTQAHPMNLPCAHNMVARERFAGARLGVDNGPAPRCLETSLL